MAEKLSGAPPRSSRWAKTSHRTSPALRIDTDDSLPGKEVGDQLPSICLLNRYTNSALPVYL